MKKYIKIRFFISIFVVLVVILPTTFIMFYEAKKEDARASLKMTSQAIKISELPPNVDYSSFAQALANTNENLRVTLIDLNGTVVGDSVANFVHMGNHLERPEVTSAIVSGYGEDIRISETTAAPTIYSATKVDESIIVRLAYPLFVTYRFLFVMLPITIGLCLFLLLFVNNFVDKFSRKLLSPLEEINNILEDKDYSNHVEEIKTFHEAEPILNNINFLVRKLNYDFEEINRTQQMRTDFVANVSHELKSPLTSIKGFAELMASGLITDKNKQKDYLQRIVTESDRLLIIINDILRLSEVEGTKLVKNEVEELDLYKLSIDVVRTLESLATKKNIRLYVQGTGIITAVQKDIYELIYNLVDNAIKYGKDNGCVEVEITTEEKNIYLKVSDDGMGIEETQLSRIFERFYRIDKSRSKKIGGTGLGLSIVRNIAVKYSGEVSVKSELLRGTTFTVKLPQKN